MRNETRGRMVAGAVDLIRRRGLNATSVREVVRYTETPRGSIAHHFPRGKQQLVEEALIFAGREVSEPLEKLVVQAGIVAGLRDFIDAWRSILEQSNFEAGCPLLAVAVEQYVGDDGLPNPRIQDRLLELVRVAFEDWQRILSTGLRKEGLTPAKARRLSALIISSVEGTVALCRAARSAQPLDDIRVELEALLVASIAEKKA
ncbi:MAG: TetR family transcriptional regulator [Pseudomonadota bacterium]